MKEECLEKKGGGENSPISPPLDPRLRRQGKFYLDFFFYQFLLKVLQLFRDYFRVL